MGFEQELRAFLQRLEQPAREPTSLAASLPVRQIDEHALRRHFLARLRDMESRGYSERTISLCFERWSSRLTELARFLERLPAPVLPVEEDQALEFACRALDVALEMPPANSSLVERLELTQLLERFTADDLNVGPYSHENQLARAVNEQMPQLTGLGAGFLRLRGRDALRWLLTAEVLQSAGATDPWRAPRNLLGAAMSSEGICRTSPWGDDFEYSFATITRLVNLDVLVPATWDEDGNIHKYVIEAGLRDIVQAVLDPGPWHAAVRALLDDERAVVWPASRSATEATIEQTKLIVHEVRNALIPVRHDIEALQSSVSEPAHRRRISDARDGVVRVLDFIDELVQASELITEPAARCEVGAVVDEALGWSAASRRVRRVQLSAPLFVIAPHGRLARAISNVVGNALQATAAGEPVRLSIQRTGSAVRIAVDDGGPGVQIEHRTRIFLEGVTMRRDGAGSGFGLAFARRVVEEVLQGKIWCEDSDLGGARFIMEIPEASS